MGRGFLEKYKKIVSIIIILVVLVLFFYLGGFISQIIFAIRQPIGEALKLPSFKILDCFKALFVFPYGFIGLGIVLVAIIALLIYMKFNFDYNPNSDDRNINFSKKATYGSARYMNEKEVKSNFTLIKNLENINEYGVILGLYKGYVVTKPLKSFLNNIFVVFGSSGSRKTRSYVANKIFQSAAIGESLFITDPKGSLYEEFRNYLENNGYEVRLFNLVNMSVSDSWYFFGELDGDTELIDIFVNIIMKTTGAKITNANPIWDNIQSNLLKALVTYIDSTYVPEKKNMTELYFLLTNNDDEELEELFKLLPKNHPANIPFSLYKKGKGKLNENTAFSLALRLQVFTNGRVQKITSKARDNINLISLGKKKCAYFCVTSDQHSTYDVLSSLMTTFLFIKLVNYADIECPNHSLPVPVHILADEIANIGEIADLTKKISTVRSRNISMSLIFQNVPQMYNRYPNYEWAEIIGNADYQLFLGCNDEITAEYISKKAGETTIEVVSETKDRQKGFLEVGAPDNKETVREDRRRLLTNDEVQRLNTDYALVMVRGQNILEVQKYDYSLHPDYNRLNIPNMREKNTQKKSKNIDEVLTCEKIKIYEKNLKISDEKVKISKEDLKGGDSEEIPNENLDIQEFEIGDVEIENDVEVENRFEIEDTSLDEGGGEVENEFEIVSIDEIFKN